MNFGTRLKKILKKNKLTQAKFSEIIHVNAGLTSRYIGGESPSGDFIMKVVKYFPNEVNYLFFGDGEVAMVNENGITYGKTPEEIVSEIEQKCQELRSCLSQ